MVKPTHNGKIKVIPTGTKVGRLTVLRFAEMRGPASDRMLAYWFCRCDCGRTATVAGPHLRRQKILSCGCLQAEITITRNLKGKHHLTGSPTYRSWISMKARCSDPTRTYYAGRGVTVCDRWRNSFEAFLADMGERPARHSLDRIDVNGHYEPSNCRWATAREQARNRRPARRS